MAGNPPWPPQQRRGPQVPPPWPGQAQGPQWPPEAAQPRPQAGQVLQGTASAEGAGSEGVRSEGFSALVTGTVAEERARFKGQLEQFRRSRPETALHHPGAGEVAEEQGETNPLVAALSTREGLAQAVLMAEVLGKPRALRPYGKK